MTRKRLFSDRGFGSFDLQGADRYLRTGSRRPAALGERMSSPEIDYEALLSSPPTRWWERLSRLSRQYDYDPNHNLRYLELMRAASRVGAREIVVLGSGKCVFESLLPKETTTISVDVSRKDLAIGAEVNAGLPNRHRVQANIFSLPFKPSFRTRMVVISEVLEHVERDDLILEVAHGLLSEDGRLLLTVPNLDRFINRLVHALGRKPYFMSEDHIREYTLAQVLKLLSQAGFSASRLVPIYLRLPKEIWLRRRFMTLTSPIRRIFLVLIPHFATYYLIMSTKVEIKVQPNSHGVS